MKKIFLAIIIATLYSCDKKNEATPESSSSITTNEEENNKTANNEANVVNTSPIQSNPNNVANINLNPVQPQTQLVQQAQQTVPGMNPPHGQPNHRCDIPVGASLSTPVQNNTNIQPTIVTTQMPAKVSTQESAQAPVKVASGINPPHGQPGHRCDIEVGAPLPTN